MLASRNKMVKRHRTCLPGGGGNGKARQKRGNLITSMDFDSSVSIFWFVLFEVFYVLRAWHCAGLKKKRVLGKQTGSIFRKIIVIIVNSNIVIVTS